MMTSSWLTGFRVAFVVFTLAALNCHVLLPRTYPWHFPLTLALQAVGLVAGIPLLVAQYRQNRRQFLLLTLFLLVSGALTLYLVVYR